MPGTKDTKSFSFLDLEGRDVARGDAPALEPGDLSSNPQFPCSSAV